MNTPGNTDATVPIIGSLDSTHFAFDATGDGTRIVVTTGLRKLFHQKYWIPIQETCPDLQPAGHSRQSVPTKWLMKVTANPPAEMKPKHRRILRMVHLICLDALAEGANFHSDKVFARETPVLQVERNVLESPEHWEPVVEVSTASAKGQNKRRREKEDDDMPGDDKAPAPKRRKPLLLFGPDVTDLVVSIMWKFVQQETVNFRPYDLRGISVGAKRASSREWRCGSTRVRVVWAPGSAPHSRAWPRGRGRRNGSCGGTFPMSTSPPISGIRVIAIAGSGDG